MAAPRLAPTLAAAAVEAIRVHGTVRLAARALNIPENTLRNRVAASGERTAPAVPETCRVTG
jgi:hypothetical protein